MGEGPFGTFKCYVNNSNTLCNKGIQCINQCQSHREVLITDRGNGLGSHRYASNSMQLTGSSHEGHKSVYYDFIGGTLSTQLNLNCDDLHRTPVIISNKGQVDRAADQLWGLGHHHQASRFQSLETNAMTQNVSIFNTSPHVGGSPILAFVHPTNNSQLKGLYNVYTQHSFNVWCPCPEPVTGPLETSHNVQINPDWISNYVNTHSDELMKSAKQSHTDLYLDFNCQKLYNCSYECHIVNIIDELMFKGSGEHVILDTNVQGVNINHVNIELQPCTNNTNTNNKQLSSIPEPATPKL